MLVDIKPQINHILLDFSDTLYRKTRFTAEELSDARASARPTGPAGTLLSEPLPGTGCCGRGRGVW